MMKFNASISQKIESIVQNKPKKESMKTQTALVVVALATMSFIPVVIGI